MLIILSGSYYINVYKEVIIKEKMKATFNNKTLMINYLLKDLSEAEAGEFEQEYFQDQAVFEQLMVVEDELIDDYVSGTLSKKNEERFEKYFLTTAKRRQRVEFAKVLLKKVESKGQLKTTPVTFVEEKDNFSEKVFKLFYSNAFALRWSLITTAMVLSFVFLWLYIKKIDLLSKELERKQIPVNVQQSKGTKEQPSPPKTASTIDQKDPFPEKTDPEIVPKTITQPIAAFVLTPSTRNAVNSKLDTSKEQKWVNIKLLIDQQLSYEKYSVLFARIGTEKNEEIWKRTLKISKRKDEQFILIPVPKDLLKPADYEFTVFSLPDETEYEQVYSFSVEK